jgi:hypothetical protein
MQVAPPTSSRGGLEDLVLNAHKFSAYCGERGLFPEIMSFWPACRSQLMHKPNPRCQWPNRRSSRSSALRTSGKTKTFSTGFSVGVKGAVMRGESQYQYSSIAGVVRK